MDKDLLCELLRIRYTAGVDNSVAVALFMIFSELRLLKEEFVYRLVTEQREEGFVAFQDEDA